MFFLSILAFFFLTHVDGYVISEEECLNYTVYPVQYELTLYPYMLTEEKFYYDCDITITVIANVPGVRVIELDAKDLDVKRDSVGVWFENRNIIDRRRPFDYDRRLGKIFLYLKEELKPYGIDKNQYYIKISFVKYMNYQENGIFVAKYNDKGIDGNLLSTRISPNYAKTMFPCFDNPQFEAVFKFRIYLPSPQPGTLHPTTSLVVADEMRRHLTRDNFTVVEFLPSPQISTHQIGVHLSTYVNHHRTHLKTNDTIAVWALAHRIRYYANILDFGLELIKAIHTYSGVKRPITSVTINLVTLPIYINNYEKGSWNLLTNGEHKLSYQIQYTSAKQREAMFFELSQQLSRIWLGNPGEMQRTRWKQEWFKEGMATYFGYYFLSMSSNSFWDMKTYGLHMKHKAMDNDYHPLVPALSSFNRTIAVYIPNQFENLVTFKTGAVLWMVEHWLGSDVFHRALQDYINTRRGKIISIDDFANYLQSASVHCEFFTGYTVGNVLNSWIEQPGYPIVTVRVYRNAGDQDAVHLEQKHFVYKDSNRRNYKYLIPISYIAQHTEDCYNCFQPKFTIGDRRYTFKENLNNGWIILNRNASGYYRVNYDSYTWNLIITTLKGPERDQINPYNRAQIVNDAFALYMAGEINLHLAKRILNGLDDEDSHIVWDAAIEGFNLLQRDSSFVQMSKQLYNHWKAFMREKVSIIYSRLANEFKRNHQTRMFRSKVIAFACYIEHSICVRNLEPEFKRVKYRQTYDPDLREICYYMLLNRSYGWDSVNEKYILNRFEKEDAISAKAWAKGEEIFTYDLPNVSGSPMELKQTTTMYPQLSEIKSTTEEPENVKIEKSSSGSANGFTINSCTRILYISVSVLFIIKNNIYN